MPPKAPKPKPKTKRQTARGKAAPDISFTERKGSRSDEVTSMPPPPRMTIHQAASYDPDTIASQIAALRPNMSNAVLTTMGARETPLSLREAAKAQHEKMLSQVAVLERLTAELPNQSPGIGHNRPPISAEDIREITNATAILKVQPIVPTAPDEARAAGLIVKKIGERLGTYLDAFLLETAKSAGKEFGKRLVQISYWLALASTLMGLGQSVTEWLR
jgi:hypothetical protein